MGEYTVGNDLIDLLVTAAKRVWLGRWGDGIQPDEDTPFSLSGLGRELILRNRLSVYLGDYDREQPIDYEWTPVDEIHWGQLSGGQYVQIATSARDYEYQSREHEEWPYSRAWAVTEAVKNWAERHLREMDWPRGKEDKREIWVGEGQATFDWSRQDGFPHVEFPSTGEQEDDAHLMARIERGTLRMEELRDTTRRCRAALFAREVLARRPEADVAYLDVEFEGHKALRIRSVSVRDKNRATLEEIHSDGHVVSADGKNDLPPDLHRGENMNGLYVEIYKPGWTTFERDEVDSMEGTWVTHLRWPAEWPGNVPTGKPPIGMGHIHNIHD